MASAISFGDVNSGFQVGLVHGPTTAEFHLPFDRPETPRRPSALIPFRRDADFVDRKTILDQIHQKCATPGLRTALVGLGGVGKSQLAIEYAYQTRDRSPETWVFWVHASNATRFEQSYREIANWVRIPGRHDPKANIFQLVHDWLYDKSKGKWLLILDNIDDTSFLFKPSDIRQNGQISGSESGNPRPLVSFLPQCQNGSILVTTRSKSAALKLVEHCNIITVKLMNSAEALTLFEKKLGVQEHRNDIGELAAALECIPLAIVQAAAYISRRAPRFSVRQYLAEFKKSDRKKTNLLNHEGGQLRRDGEAKNSIIIAWQLSFDHIRETRPSAANLLSLMSFFDQQGIPEALLRHGTVQEDGQQDRNEYDSDDEQGYDEDYVSESSDDFEHDVLTLRNFSFISINADGATFEIHRLVQLATRKWLEAHGQLERWKQKSIQNLCKEFPTGDHANWVKCQALFPHAKSLLNQQPENEVALNEWALMLYNAAWYAWAMGNYADAEKMSIKSVQARRTLFGTENEKTLSSTALLALAYKLGGRWKEAEELEMQVMDARQRLLGAEHPDTLSSMADFAITHRYRGNWNDAEELETQVMEIRQRILGAEHPSTLTSIANLASTFWSQGRWNDAEELLVQATETSKKVLGRDHPDTLSCMANLATVRRDRGKWKEAEELGVQVMETRQRILGADHPSMLTSRADLALTFWNQGRWREAEELFVQAMDASKRVLGWEHPDTLSCMANVAMARRYRGKWAEAEGLETKVMEIQQRILGAEHPSTLTSIANLASTFWSQGRWNDAEELLVQATETSKKVLGRDHPDTLSCMANLATVRRDRGKWKEAEELGVQVMETSSRVRGKEHPDTLSCMANLATTRRYQGRWYEAEELEVEVMRIRQRILGSEHPSTLKCMANLASTLWVQGRWKEAESLNVQAMNTSLRVLGDDHPDTLSSISNLATSHWLQGQWAEAQALEMQAILGRKKVLGAEHPDTLSSMNGLALIYKSRGRLNDAEDLEMQVVEIRTRIMGPEHPDTLSSVGNLASIYRLQKRWDEAEHLQRQVQTTTEALLGKEHPDAISSLSNLASIYWSKGLWKEAEELDLESIKMREMVLGKKHPETLTSRNNLSRTYHSQQRWDEAEKLSREVWEVMTQVLGSDHPHTLSAMAGLAQTWRRQGKFDEAVPLLEVCVRLREQRLGPEHPTTKASANALTKWQNQINTVQTALSGTTMSLSSEARAAHKWFERLDRMNLLLRRKRKAGGYHRVKLAILDTGIDSKNPYWKKIKGYKDFVAVEEQEGIDKTGHGTNGVYLIFKVIPEVEVYVARVFDGERATEATSTLVAQAIKHAVFPWMVDIIILSCGFKDDYEDIRCAILEAKAHNILIFAAASNDGNVDHVTFPARMVGDVICIFSSDGKIKPSSFNPAPLKHSFNFAVLGEEVESIIVSTAKSEERDSGTSIATFIAAGIAALVLDFSMQEDCRDRIENQKILKSIPGMSAVFEKMAKGDQGYLCVAPWRVLECNENFSSGWKDEKKRGDIAATISRTLRDINRA